MLAEQKFHLLEGHFRQLIKLCQKAVSQHFQLDVSSSRMSYLCLFIGLINFSILTPSAYPTPSSNYTRSRVAVNGIAVRPFRVSPYEDGNDSLTFYQLCQSPPN